MSTYLVSSLIITHMDLNAPLTKTNIKLIQSTFGNKQIFVTRCFNVPFVVLNVTTLVNPSLPVWMSLITTFFHTKGGDYLPLKALHHQSLHFADVFPLIPLLQPMKVIMRPTFPQSLKHLLNI